MKLTTLASAVILIGGVASVQAGTPSTLSYNSDDLLLGFRATAGTGSTLDYLVDIGQASLYTAPGQAFTLNIGNIGADLAATFGGSWYSSGNVIWSVSGTPGTQAPVGSDPIKLLYATAPESGGVSTPWLGNSSMAQGGAAGRMINVGAQYVTSLTGSTSGLPNYSSTNSAVGLIQNTSDINSYASYMPGGGNSDSTDAYKLFNPTIEGGVSARLDLYRIPAVYNVSGSNVGTFSLNSAGVITYTPKTSVPEPSMVGLLGVASALWLARRRSAKAVSSK